MNALIALPTKPFRVVRIMSKPPYGDNHAYTFHGLWEPPYDPDDIDQAFMLFHTSNPHVYNTLVEEARKLRRMGWKRIGMKFLYERARWILTMKSVIPENMEPYKLNNNYTSRYARLIMEQEPDLNKFFEIRKLNKPKEG